MKALLTSALLLITVLSVFVQAVPVKAETTPITIQNIIPNDIFGNVNYYVSRGFSLTVKIQLTSSTTNDFNFVASLFDTNNVPAGIASGNFHVMPGENTLTLDLFTSTFAYVGLGNLHITVSNIDHSIVTSRDQQVLIQISGDFDKDEKVGANDLAFFLAGYSLYWQNACISPQYQQCDFNRDNRLDSRDIAFLVCSYNFYWNRN